MAELTAPGLELVCYTFLCVLKLKLRPSASAGLNLPAGPWKLPVIGHMHLLLGALPHHAMHRLSQPHGPVMLLRLGHVPTLVVSSPEAAREVMKAHDAAFADRPVYATADIFSYGGENIAFARADSRHWKAVRKLCTVELLGPKRVRSFRALREGEAARLVRSAAAAFGPGPSPAVVNVSEKVKAMMNDIIMMASVGDRCAQRDAYIEEMDMMLNLLPGFNLIDLFPASRLARVLGGGALRTAREVRDRIQSIMDDMIRDHEKAMDQSEEGGDAGHEKEDILTTLLRFQRGGGMGITLTNENVCGIMFVSQYPLIFSPRGQRQRRRRRSGPCRSLSGTRTPCPLRSQKSVESSMARPWWWRRTSTAGSTTSIGSSKRH